MADKEFKPTFQLNEKLMLTKQHLTAWHNAQKSLGSSGSGNINTIFNTGCFEKPSTDDKTFFKNFENYFKNKKGLYEVAVIVDLTKEDPSIASYPNIVTADWSTITPTVRNLLDDIVEKAHKQLVEYIKFFISEETSKKIKLTDVISTIYGNLKEALKIEKDFSIGEKNKSDESDAKELYMVVKVGYKMN